MAHNEQIPAETITPSANVSGGNTGWWYGMRTGTVHVPSCCTCDAAQAMTYSGAGALMDYCAVVLAPATRAGVVSSGRSVLRRAMSKLP